MIFGSDGYMFHDDLQEHVLKTCPIIYVICKYYLNCIVALDRNKRVASKAIFKMVTNISLVNVCAVQVPCIPCTLLIQLSHML